METTSKDTGRWLVVKEGPQFEAAVIATTNMSLIFKKCSHEEQDYIYAYFFRSYPIKQPIDRKEHRIRWSAADPEDRTKPFAPRIYESVHGYFQLCDDYPSRFDLSSSWDAASLVNQQVHVYGINNKTAQPVHIQHLILDELPRKCMQ